MIYLLLWAVLFPISIALGFYFLSGHNVRSAVICFGGSFILVVLLLLTFQHQRSLCQSDSGELIAGEFQTPEEDICRDDYGPNAITFRMGGIIVLDTVRTHINVLATPSHVILALDHDQARASISSTLYNDEGAIMAQIDKNHFNTVGPVMCERPDLSTLIVRKWYGCELLYARYANPHTFIFRGRFAYPKLETVTVTDDQIYQGETPISRMNCIRTRTGTGTETIDLITDFPASS
jgi:hypothetical protein